MPKKKGKQVQSAFITAAVAVAIVAILAYLVITESSGKSARDAVAVVNGQPITQAELDASYDTLPPQYKIALTKDEFLGQLIDRTLIVQEAQRQGHAPSEQQVDEELALLRSGFPTEEAFQQALSQEGLSEEGIRAELRQRMAIEGYLSGLAESIQISEEEKEQYYQDNLEQFTARGDQVRVAHILLQTEEEAQAVLEELRAGGNFRELALLHSIDPSVQTNGGDLGFITKGDTVPEFEDAAFLLDVLGVSSPVKTQYGFHLITRLPDTITFEEAKLTISNLILSGKQASFLEEVLAGLRAEASIEYPGLPVKNAFKGTGDALCASADGKPILRAYTSSRCPDCADVLSTLSKVAAEYEVELLLWELDTGDNLVTLEEETALPKQEFALLQRYNPQGAVPAYVFGCAQVRIGNAYTPINLHVEDQEFRSVIEKLYEP